MSLRDEIISKAGATYNGAIIELAHLLLAYIDKSKGECTCCNSNQTQCPQDGGTNEVPVTELVPETDPVEKSSTKPSKRKPTNAQKRKS